MTEVDQCYSKFEICFNLMLEASESGDKWREAEWFHQTCIHYQALYQMGAFAEVVSADYLFQQQFGL